MKYRVIAIEREFASGGQEIGTELAKRLGIPCYGREILQMAAEQLGVSEEYLEGIEEKATGSILYSLYVIAGMTNMNSQGSMSGENQLFLTESEIIRRLTQTPAVIVGRCAVDSLKDRSDVLRVFVRGDMTARTKRAQEVYHVAPDRVNDTIRRMDKRRSSCFKANTGRDWKDSANYQIVLDSGKLGIEKCIEMLETCCR